MSNDTPPAPDEWNKELEILILRHEEQGAVYDLHSMTDSERWGLYLYLTRLVS